MASLLRRVDAARVLGGLGLQRRLERQVLVLSSGSNSGRDPPPPDHVDAQLAAVLDGVRVKLGAIDGVQTAGPKFLLQFTCSHGACARPEPERTSTKIISQKAYKDGIVLVRCSCEKLHLIADRLGWFGAETDIEHLLAAKGERVVRKMIEDESLQLG
jgi:hypothetical protein